MFKGYTTRVHRSSQYFSSFLSLRIVTVMEDDSWTLVFMIRTSANPWLLSGSDVSVINYCTILTKIRNAVNTVWMAVRLDAIHKIANKSLAFLWTGLG